MAPSATMPWLFAVLVLGAPAKPVPNVTLERGDLSVVIPGGSQYTGAAKKRFPKAIDFVVAADGLIAVEPGGATRVLASTGEATKGSMVVSFRDGAIDATCPGRAAYHVVTTAEADNVRSGPQADLPPEQTISSMSFLYQDKSGKALAGPYRVGPASGPWYFGMADAAGTTARIYTCDQTQLEIVWPQIELPELVASRPSEGFVARTGSAVDVAEVPASEWPSLRDLAWYATGRTTEPRLPPPSAATRPRDLYTATHPTVDYTPWGSWLFTQLEKPVAVFALRARIASLFAKAAANVETNDSVFFVVTQRLGPRAYRVLGVHPLARTERVVPKRSSELVVVRTSASDDEPRQVTLRIALNRKGPGCLAEGEEESATAITVDGDGHVAVSSAINHDTCLVD